MKGTSPPTTEQQANRWADIYRRHQSWLWTVIRSRVSCRDEAADVLQEVACALVQQKKPPESIERLEPWLYRLVLRQVALFRRRMGRLRRHQQKWLAESREPSTDQASGLDWVLREESRAQIRQAIDGLRPGDRDILLLKYVERWSYERIAHHLGVSRHAVEYRLQRGRDVLRRQLSSLAEISLGMMD